MNRDVVDFELASEIDSQAIGRPGERTFRIRVRKDAETASLWLEKQQLQALCLAMRQLLGQRQPEAPSGPPGLPMDRFPDAATVEFKVGRLALGWDEARERFVIMAQPEEPGPGEPSLFRCQVEVPQAIAFCNLSEAICAAGRPVCPLCLEPIDADRHTCVRGNGHFQGRDIPKAEAEEE